MRVKSFSLLTSATHIAGMVGLLLAGSLLHAQTSAPTELAATRVAAASATTARFTLGLTRTNGASFEAAATTTDSVRIMGTIRPETTQIGQSADIYVVASLSGNFFMRNGSGNFVAWNGQVAELTPFRSGVALSSNTAVDFLTGSIPVAGTFSLFLGYKAPDGVLTYSSAPLQITISTPEPPPPALPPVKTAREEAMDFYTANISSIVLTNPGCITCHLNTNPAGVTPMHFVTGNNSNHLSLNFAQLETRLKARGRAFILTKVLGGNAHGGGALFSSSNNQGYRNLDSFLQMLEKL